MSTSTPTSRRDIRATAATPAGTTPKELTPSQMRLAAARLMADGYKPLHEPQVRLHAARGLAGNNDVLVALHLLDQSRAEVEDLKAGIRRTKDAAAQYYEGWLAALGRLQAGVAQLVDTADDPNPPEPVAAPVGPRAGAATAPNGGSAT